MKKDSIRDDLFNDFFIADEGAIQLADKMKLLKEKANKKEQGLQSKTVKDLFFSYVQDKKIPVVKKGSPFYSSTMIEIEEIKTMAEEDGYVTKLTHYDDIPVLLVFKEGKNTVQYLWYGKIMKFNNKKSHAYLVNAKTLRNYLNSNNDSDIE